MAWGYINKCGELAINLKFNFAYEFQEGIGIACVRDDKGYTCIYPNEELLFHKHFNNPLWFSNERARLSDKILEGFIDLEGEWAIEPRYNYVSNFCEGLAQVRKGIRSYYIDKEGAVLIDPNCARASDFRCGLALITFQGKDYYINHEGSRVLGPYDLGEDFRDGVAAVKKDGENYFIDTKGDLLFKYEYPFVSSYCSEDRIPFEQDDKHGFLNRQGKLVIDPEFDEVSGFHNGVARFIRGKKTGFVDREGVVLFERSLKVLENLHEELALFSEDGVRYGFCDRNGDVIVAPHWAYARSFSFGLAAVSDKPL